MSFLTKYLCLAAKLAGLGLWVGLLVGCQPSGSPTQEEGSATHQTNQTSSPTMQTFNVETYQGILQGVPSERNADIAIFRGIPYAAAPIGEKRWQPPHSPQPWQGIRDASKFGSACPQPTGQEEFVWSRDNFQINEDCLYLNVWSEDITASKPVMVWFHGGAHTGGKAHDLIFEGTTLAESGVVLVTVNYRLGPLGFLAHPLLAEESSHASSGNYGLLDKIAALNWVRDNIAQFGGDPANVTIFGQSAGSQSVCSLMTSPLARGMFHKVIGQSASCLNPQSTKDLNGQERGIALVSTLPGDGSLEAMRAATPTQLLTAAQSSGWANQSRLVVDGWVLPEAPGATFAAGNQARLPIMIGSLGNEGNQLFPMNETLTESELDQSLTRFFDQPQIAKLKAMYALQLSQSPGLAQREINTDLFMAYGMRRWAKLQHAIEQPTFLYFMDHNPPAFRLYNPGNPDLGLDGGPKSQGAYHSGDLAYVFGNTDLVGHGWEAHDHELSETIVGYWTNFAKTGNPNGDGLPDWSAYAPERHETQLFTTTAHTANGVRQEVLDLFEQALGD